MYLFVRFNGMCFDSCDCEEKLVLVNSIAEWGLISIFTPAIKIDKPRVMNVSVCVCAESVLGCVIVECCYKIYCSRLCPNLPEIESINCFKHLNTPYF